MLEAVQKSCHGCPHLAFCGSPLICHVRVSFAGVLLCDLHSHKLLTSFASFDIVI